MKKYESIKRNLLKDKKVKAEYDKLKGTAYLIDKIIEMRLKHNMSQEEFAKKLGTKQSGIARLEKASTNPTVAYLARIAKVFNKKLSIEFK